MCRYKVILSEEENKSVLQSFHFLENAKEYIKDLIDEIQSYWDPGNNRIFVFKTPPDKNDKKYIHEVYTMDMNGKEYFCFMYFIQ